MNGFTKCVNGHYYKEALQTCPYCPVVNKSAEIAAHKKETQFHSDTLEKSSQSVNNRTVFGEDIVAELGNGEKIILKEYRNKRKLVGWLITYSFDMMGVDFRLYEGRNIIGRDKECDIVVPDKMISSKHATILFKNDKFKIKDELSSHGTFVNNRDIEDNTIELKDNDIICIGETIFKFRLAI